MSKFIFNKQKDGDLVLSRKGSELRIKKDKKYTHCIIKSPLGENIYSAFAERSLKHVVRMTLRDFVYLRKGDRFFEEVYTLICKGDNVLFEGHEESDNKKNINHKRSIRTSYIPKNIQQLLLNSGIEYIEDIPKDVTSLSKIKGMGHVKIKKLMEIIT